MKLYFLHSDGTEEFVCKTEEKHCVSDALMDLYRRNPKYKTYYQRTWTDGDGWIWIDVGSHSEFWIARNE